ncbi:MAG: O-antigen ligase family protein [Armatimonadota bacterium]|nr:O-antigen ligase family protein [Armatimonadota bacterium]MDR7452012.1 O-antigen ligase family protein [Armatimonadota bacterium]MDR7467903.1 O-antigen ligase family protein [Armatimonadota bacterium]MDR7494244.1 O-antigen ligase family protein [Armatimonadota bacterium]MDR7500025.1 O-antigen ligase family protein [Armatimonadota bacterium]
MPPRWPDRLQRAALLLTVALFSGGYATWGLVVMLVAVASEGVLTHTLPWTTTPLDGVVAGFVSWFLLAGYLSEFRAIAVGSTGLAALTIYLAFGGASRVLLRDPGFLRPLLWTWLAGGAAAGAAAFLLHLRRSAPAALPELGQNAVGTTAMAALLIALGLALLFAGTRRYLALLLALPPAAALVTSYTRGAWIGAGVGLLALTVLAGRRHAVRALLLGAALVAAVLVSAGPERGALVRRALTVADPQVNLNRIYLLRTARLIIADHPVFGTGLNTFSQMTLRYRLPGDPNPPGAPFAHNIFLNMAAEGGIVAALLFVAVVIQALRCGLRWWRGAPEEARILSAVVIAVFLAMMTHQLFDGTLLSVHLGAGMWLVIGILAARGGGRA